MGKIEILPVKSYIDDDAHVVLLLRFILVLLICER